MTKEELTAKFRGAIEDLTTKNTPLTLAAATISKDVAERVFVEGKNSQGGKIGTYNSTKPIYIDPNAAPKKVKQVGKKGTPIKSGFYESYKEFRRDMGRESEFVNLELNAQLSGDYRTGLSQRSVNKWVVELKNQHNAEKAAGLQGKYGRVFDITAIERSKLHDILTKELARLFSV